MINKLIKKIRLMCHQLIISHLTRCLSPRESVNFSNGELLSDGWDNDLISSTTVYYAKFNGYSIST